MATGRLGAQDLSAGLNTTVYEVPADTFSVVTLNIANRSSSTITVRVAIAASATPLNAEYIEYDSQITANGVLERTGIVMDRILGLVQQTLVQWPTGLKPQHYKESIQWAEM
jgi:hypothetical protein